MAIGTLGAIALGASAIGGVVSSANNRRATNQAVDASTQATRENNALAREIYGQNQQTLAPFVQQGGAATSYINQLLGIGGNADQANAGFDAFRNSTGYNFRLNEGMRAINANHAARGQLNSGDTLRRLQGLGQDMATAEFGNYFNALAGQQGVGLNAASAQTGVASNFSGQVQQNNAQNASNIGNAALARAGNNNAFLSSLIGAGGYALGARR